MLNGGNGLGQVVAHWAVNHSLDVARRFGVAATTVRRSNHLGALGYFTRQAAEQGMMAFLTQNTRNNMAPAGGRHAGVGNNPFSIAVPSTTAHPVVLDCACSAVARSHIDVAAEHGAPIPVGWALDRDGLPTTDASEALLGALLPFAGHKGSGMAVMMGALAGVLSGAKFGSAVPPQSDYGQERDLGHFLFLVDVGQMMDPGEMSSRMSKYISEIRSVAPTPGVDAVMVPGERAHYERLKAHALGVSPDRCAGLTARDRCRSQSFGTGDRADEITTRRRFISGTPVPFLLAGEAGHWAAVPTAVTPLI